MVENDIYVQIMGNPKAVDQLKMGIKMDYKWRFGCTVSEAKIFKQAYKLISKKINSKYTAT